MYMYIYIYSDIKINMYIYMYTTHKNADLGNGLLALGLPH